MVTIIKFLLTFRSLVLRFQTRT